LNFGAPGILIGGGLLFGYNRVLLVGMNESLARSRGRNVWWTQVLFCAAIAVVVTMNLRWVGILIINSLLILPAAAARNLAANTRQYVFGAIGLALFSGISGVIGSFYADTATSATIVLVLMGCFLLTFGIKLLKRTGSRA
jgi:zinc transport system permease protein